MAKGTDVVAVLTSVGKQIAKLAEQVKSLSIEPENLPAEPKADLEKWHARAEQAKARVAELEGQIEEGQSRLRELEARPRSYLREGAAALQPLPEAGKVAAELEAREKDLVAAREIVAAAEAHRDQARRQYLESRRAWLERVQRAYEELANLTGRQLEDVNTAAIREALGGKRAAVMAKADEAGRELAEVEKEIGIEQ